MAAQDSDSRNLDKRFTGWQLFGIVGGSLTFLLLIMGGLFTWVIHSSISGAAEDRKEHLQLLQQSLNKAQEQNINAWGRLEKHTAATEGLTREVKELVGTTRDGQDTLNRVADKVGKAAESTDKAAKAMQTVVETLSIKATAKESDKNREPN